MTRRIALAILATCWLVLLAGGAVAYVSIRHALLAELDDSLVRRAALLPEVAGIPDVGTGYALPDGDRYVVRNARGQTVDRSGMRRRTPSTAGPARPRGAKFATLADGTSVRSVTVAFPDPQGGEVTVVYSSTAERYHRLIQRLWLTFIAVGLAAGLLTAGVAFAVARSALRPLTATANTVASIDDRSLDRRLDVQALPAELRPMAERLNQMLARLDVGLRQRKQFMADAAHELRTPVSALMTNIEVALRRPRDAAALTGVLQECLGDVRVLRRLVEALLEQFRADAIGVRSVQRVDLSALLDLCVDGAASTARQKGIVVKRSYPRDLSVTTEPQRVRSIVSNLLDNALEYNVAGGWVDLSAEVTEKSWTLRVRDTGRGIPQDMLPHVFEPFFRGHQGNDGAGHCGLGLFLVRSHVQSLGGTCEVAGDAGVAGTEFVVRLPTHSKSDICAGAGVEPGSHSGDVAIQPPPPSAAAVTNVVGPALTTFSFGLPILFGVG